MLRSRTRIAMVVTAAAATSGVGALSASAPVSALPPTGAQTSAESAGLPADVTPVRTRKSLTGTHLWYEQRHQGLPVVGGYYVRHLGADGTVSVRDGRASVPATLSMTATVSSAVATANAQQAIAAKARVLRPANPKAGSTLPLAAEGKASLAVSGGASPALVWKVVSRSGQGVTRSLVDARTGVVREVRLLSQHVDGRGRVFDPNPVVGLRDEALTDQNDRNAAVPFSAYKDVVLRNLDGSGTLTGRHARIVAAKGGLAQSPTNTFLFQRRNDRFEQVNAYYATSKAQEYIHSLGFTEVNNESQDVETNLFPEDNSFYDPSTDTISFGEGGVDDGEDEEVVWHEYGHAIHDDQVPGFGATLEAGSIGEGFGDYLAVTMSVPVSRGFDLPCVMDWDATSYTQAPHCLRRTDTGKTTDDIEGEVHADGEIWSHALWDIHQTLGRNRANKIILESQFYYAPDTSFADAARAVVASARAQYGERAAAVVTQAFQARKIL